MIPKQFFTEHVVTHLSNIRFKLLVEDEVYFRGLMYSNDIWVNLDPKINRCYWEYISSLYLSGDKYIEYYPVDRLLKYMADLTKEILKKKACCNLHS